MDASSMTARSRLGVRRGLSLTGPRTQVPCAECPVKVRLLKSCHRLGESYRERRLIKQMLARPIQSVTFCRNDTDRE
jgi:hypothetical protein